MNRPTAVGHAADGDVLDVRRLGPRTAAILLAKRWFQRLQVVADRREVHFRRQLHRQVAPVAVGEDAELAGGDEDLQALLRLDEFGAVAAPVGQAFPPGWPSWPDRPSAR